MKKILCRQTGAMDVWHAAVVDNDDYEMLSRHTWRVRKRACNHGHLYPETTIFVADPKTKRKVPKKVSMHRMLMGYPKGLTVDHRNRNALDNRRANLRLATASEQAANRKRFQKKKTANGRFKGVRKTASGNFEAVFHSSVVSRNKIRLGTYKTEIEAARAYDETAKKYFGEFAQLNFP